jgi:ADP-ribose pyrophosphatase YjhB (NUDIX family)
MKQFNFEQPYVGLNAIIIKNDKILMVKEADGPYKGKWNFPGGRWDQKETLIAGVSREAREETGLTFKPNAILGLYTKFRNRPSMTVVALQIIFLGNFSGELKILSNDVDFLVFER